MAQWLGKSSAEEQLRVISETGDIKLDTTELKKLAMNNASNAELAAASCGELDLGFTELNDEMKKMLGR